MREQWVPLARNKYDKDVAGILAPAKDSSEGWVFVLPRLERIDEVVLELVETLLPRFAPQIFELGDGSAWTDDPEYEHHDICVLREEVAQVRRQAEAEVLAMETRIEAARR